ncbi:CLUMA_CG021650, isoform A [Clunio marinus]|uniref:CLUMA_CG021650, isoform A n=1 Tax=Clunio marinus TaxID=568069 RepID=A0A1J1JBN9_9DIPT|nr:CLUMA_CG021650, isoform A [Clunio marinus]
MDGVKQSNKKHLDKKYYATFGFLRDSCWLSVLIKSISTAFNQTAAKYEKLLLYCDFVENIPVDRT